MREDKSELASIRDSMLDQHIKRGRALSAPVRLTPLPRILEQLEPRSRSLGIQPNILGVPARFRAVHSLTLTRLVVFFV